MAEVQMCSSRGSEYNMGLRGLQLQGAHSDRQWEGSAMVRRIKNQQSKHRKPRGTDKEAEECCGSHKETARKQQGHGRHMRTPAYGIARKDPTLHTAFFHGSTSALDTLEFVCKMQRRSES